MDYERLLPTARIFVFDNNSRDRTAEIARTHVVQHIFDTMDADVYLMADGNDTYPAEAVPLFIATSRRTGADMVMGARLNDYVRKSFYKFHQWGNVLLA